MKPEGSGKTSAACFHLLEEGYRPVDIAKMIGVDRHSVRRWKYLKKGQSGIQAISACGRPPKLDQRNLSKLEKALLRGAQKAGFPTDLWTCQHVVKVIDSLFGGHYHVDHLGRLLHALGWIPEKPERRAIERNEEAIKQ